MLEKFARPAPSIQVSQILSSLRATLASRASSEVHWQPSFPHASARHPPVRRQSNALISPATTRGVRRSSCRARCAMIQPQCVAHLFGQRTGSVGSREPRAAARRGANNRDPGALFAPFKGQSPAISSSPGDASPCLFVRLTPLRLRRQMLPGGPPAQPSPVRPAGVPARPPFYLSLPSPYPKDVQPSSHRARR
jgi:hypothetical protein